MYSSAHFAVLSGTLGAVALGTVNAIVIPKGDQFTCNDSYSLCCLLRDISIGGIPLRRTAYSCKFCSVGHEFKR
jgi:hypothetical protein